MDGVILQNPPKALIALIALLCVTTLLLSGRVSEEAGMGLIGLIVGYAIGNGIAAKNGDPVEPIIGRDQDHNKPGRDKP